MNGVIPIMLAVTLAGAGMETEKPYSDDDLY